MALVRGEATLKRYYGDGPRVRLQPANASMKALTYDARDVTVQGVVTGLMRSYALLPAAPGSPSGARPAARTGDRRRRPREPWLECAPIQGDVPKWLRERSAKPLFGGSNPPVASTSS